MHDFTQILSGLGDIMKLYEESTLSKKLKRRIQELCGFNDLEREERVIRANEILNSTDLKQSICHKILGTTFKDVERAMEAIIKEKQLTPEQREEAELRKSHPEKYEPEFDADFEFKVNKKAADAPKTSGYRTYSREEVAELIAASKAPTPPPTPIERSSYPTYSKEQVRELLRDHFSYKDEQKRKREEERVKWDSQKTTEFGPKTANTAKRTNSTKA